jgi:hypothetical protein
MAIEKVKPDAGKGGKLGRSNMSYWGSNDEAKAAGRKLRRQAGHQAVEEGMADALAPERPVTRKKKRTTSR